MFWGVTGHNMGCWWCCGGLSIGLAGGELSSVTTTQPDCSSFFSSKCWSGVEVSHSLLCTRTRKGSVGVEADGCVWVIL